MLISTWPPNTALHRTPAAAPLSPVSFQALGARGSIFCAGLLFVVGLAKCAAVPDPAAVAVGGIRNSDLRWEGTFFGEWPGVTGEAAKRVLSFGERATPALLAALDDPDRFAIAHVLLIEVESTVYWGSGPEWRPRWAPLKMQMQPDGRIEFFPEQRTLLKEFWRVSRQRA